eukprot:Awhi_evm1s15010
MLYAIVTRPHEIDEAARRRLVKQLYIPLPDVSGRRQIVEKLLKNISHELCDEDKNEIIADTEGYSGSDMSNLCKEAALGPIRDAFNSHSDFNISDMDAQQ